ncbi:MAG TPA: DUF3618 domain-containing protein [Acidimicrobiales bacterium]|nr:DUF3618 domain-containing protein [Acidimicrobiales bacterium]
MSKNANEIRSEIEQTRGALGSTLEALGDRVAPKKVAARAKADVAERVDVVRNRLNPVGALRRGTSRLKGSLQGDSTPSNGAGAVTRRTGNGSSRAAVADAPAKLAEKAGSAAEALSQQASGKPLALGLLAFGAGVAVAGLLPPTERERQVAGRVKERVEPLKEQALDAGRSIVGELKPAAQAGLEQVKERAAGAVEQVKEEAKGAAGEVKEGAQTTTREVKATTKAASGRVRSEARSSTAAVKNAAKGSAKAAKQTVKRSARSRPSTSASARRTTSGASRPTTSARASRAGASAAPKGGASRSRPRASASTPRGPAR